MSGNYFEGGGPSTADFEFVVSFSKPGGFRAARRLIREQQGSWFGLSDFDHVFANLIGCEIAGRFTI